jgi:hypothetical protein
VPPWISSVTPIAPVIKVREREEGREVERRGRGEEEGRERKWGERRRGQWERRGKKALKWLWVIDGRERGKEKFVDQLTCCDVMWRDVMWNALTQCLIIVFSFSFSFSSEIKVMLADTMEISKKLELVRLDLACEPIRNYWYQLFNSGENQDENQNEN